MYVIPFVNQKGGVGKSTLSLNLGAALAHFGMRVILIDLDPQATSTAATLGPGDRPGTPDLLDYAAAQRSSLSALAIDAPEWGFRIVPSSYEGLRQREAALLDDAQSGQFALLDALAAEEDAADVVIADCPPNYGPLTSCALVAGNGIVAPIEPAGESTHGLALLERRIVGARRVNSQLASLGIVIIGFQGRYRVDQDVRDVVSEGTGFGWVHTVRQTNGFRRAFIEQRPLRAIAASESEVAAVGEIDVIAAELANATGSAAAAVSV
jgi:chromosome partitioning protein